MGLVFISLSVFSCSTDELENQDVKGVKFEKRNELATQKPDSIIVGAQPLPDNGGENVYGDPSNPKPPRR
ncbi:hypothetical protein [Flavobacterium hercynium]|uniref:hypothetical protein n=1 Tax=Flavobacterium hercynium TaxID=387094 RepID=UPI001AD836DD|nr:hypothetical protein [Flavobacterium hercynium]